MAENISLVDPDQGTGWDYDSLSGWESGEQGAINSGDQEVAECTSSSGSDDTTSCTIAGWSGIDASSYIIVRAKTGDEAGKSWDGNKYVLDAKLQPDEDYIRIEKIQIQQPADYALRVRGSNISTDGCFIKGMGDGSSDAVYLNTGGTCEVKNTIVLNADDDGIVNGTASNKVYNCVFYGCGNRGVVGGNQSTLVMKNVVSMDNTGDDFNAINGESDSDYCCSSDTTAPGSNSQASKTASSQFTSVTGGSEDFSVKDTNADIYDNGVGPSSDANVPTTDIDGDTRSGSTCDIGVDEYIASGNQEDVDGTLTTSGALSRVTRFKRIPDGAFTPQGATTRFIQWQRSADATLSLSGAAAFLSATTRAIAGALSFAGALTRKYIAHRTITAEIPTTAVLTRVARYFRVQVGDLNVSASTGWSSGQSIAGNVPLSGAVTPKMTYRRNLSASMAMSGGAKKTFAHFRRDLTGVLSFVGASRPPSTGTGGGRGLFRLGKAGNLR